MYFITGSILLVFSERLLLGTLPDILGKIPRIKVLISMAKEFWDFLENV